MRFLPVVERELRIAARAKATHRSRFLSALAGAFVLGAMTMTMQRHVAPSQIGAGVFGTITFLLTWFCLIGGVVTTFDRLSEERRQGTLGLLFLTPLRDFDIILGKFAGATATVIFGAIAVTPVLAITLAMGGVTFGELGRIALALLTLLFFGAAAGLLVSSFMEDASRALLAAIAFVAVWLLLIELAGALQSWLFGEILPIAAFSPIRLPFLAEDGSQAVDPWRFYRAFACVQGVSWLFLLAATRFTARTRQAIDKTRRNQRETARPNAALPSRARRRPGRSGLPPGLLDGNPAAWLALRNSPHRRLLPILTLGAALVIFGILAAGAIFDEDLWFGPALVAGYFINLLVKLWIGVAACQMFNEARRTGALEFLLATPLPPARVVFGHQDALQKMFEPTVWKILAIQCAPIVIGFNGEVVWTILIPLCAFITLMTDLRAMAWLGLWNGLIHSKMHAALGRTVFRVMIVPWLIFLVPCLGWILFLCSPIYSAIVANSAEERFFNHFPRIVTEPGAYKDGKPIALRRPPPPARRPTRSQTPPPLNT